MTLKCDRFSQRIQAIDSNIEEEDDDLGSEDSEEMTKDRQREEDLALSGGGHNSKKKQGMLMRHSNMGFYLKVLAGIAAI